MVDGSGRLREGGGMKTYVLKGVALLSPKEQDDRDIATLQGLCRGILADGVVNEAEAREFQKWVERFHAQNPVWPLTDIVERLDRIFDDGVVDEAEAAELKWVMEALCGIASMEPESPGAAILLPVNDPQPPVVFKGREFVVTGNFAKAKRAVVMGWIEQRGGVARDTVPTRDTDYLVIGAIPSKGWKHGSWGRKIEDGVQLRDGGGKLAVISEEHFLRAIEGTV